MRARKWLLSRPVFISSSLPNIPLFEQSRSHLIQFISVFMRPKLQLAGYLVEIIIPRYLGLVCKISRYLSSASSPARRLTLYARTLSKISRANFLSLSFKFQVKSRADENAICNFWIISQIRNSELFDNLELMRTGLPPPWKRNWGIQDLLRSKLGSFIMNTIATIYFKKLT